MAAQRYSIHPRAYAWSRTPVEMRLDVEAWTATWLVPAKALMGSSSSGRPSDSAVSSPRSGEPVVSGRLPSRYHYVRQRAGERLHAVNIEALRREHLPAVNAAAGLGFAKPGAEPPSLPKMSEVRKMLTTRKARGGPVAG